MAHEMIDIGIFGPYSTSSGAQDKLRCVLLNHIKSSRFLSNNVPSEFTTFPRDQQYSIDEERTDLDKRHLDALRPSFLRDSQATKKVLLFRTMTGQSSLYRRNIGLTVTILRDGRWLNTL